MNIIALLGEGTSPPIPARERDITLTHANAWRVFIDLAPLQAALIWMTSIPLAIRRGQAQ
jgi:hypothetical protein